MFAIARKLSDSIGAMIFGFILVLAAGTLHAWNEYRTVHRSRGLAEARRIIQTIPDALEVAEELEGKLVFLSGRADTHETLQDDRFFVSQNGIHLARRVSMYQWVEHKETRSNSQNQQQAVYSYRSEWASQPVDSDQFAEPEGHRNPPMSVHGQEWTAKLVSVGHYELIAELKEMMQDWQPISLNAQAILENVPQHERANYLVQQQELFFGNKRPDPNNPRIGDTRVRFEYVPSEVVSVAARLSGHVLNEYKTSNGEGILKLVVGQLDAQSMMARLDTENSIFAWVLRIFGTLICVFGCALSIKPLTTLVNLVPIVGQITSGILVLVAILSGLLVSATVIGASWILVRPLLGLSIFLLAGLMFVLIARIRRANVNRLPPIISN